MTGAQKSLTDAAARATATRSGSFLSTAGIGGVALEWKHGLKALSEPFAGCQTLWEGAQRLQSLDDTIFLGLGMWLAILVGSVVAISVGIYRLAWATAFRIIEKRSLKAPAEPGRGASEHRRRPARPSVAAPKEQARRRSS